MVYGSSGGLPNNVSVTSNDQVERTAELLPDNLTMVLTGGGSLIQIAPRGCSKLAAVEMVLDREAIDMTGLVAFGDDNNDKELLNAAGLGVAMANATPEVLSVADHVTDSNDDDGVAAVLKGLLDGSHRPTP